MPRYRQTMIWTTTPQQALGKFYQRRDPTILSIWEVPQPCLCLEMVSIAILSKSWSPQLRQESPYELNELQAPGLNGRNCKALSLRHNKSRTFRCRYRPSWNSRNGLNIFRRANGIHCKCEGIVFEVNIYIISRLRYDIVHFFYWMLIPKYLCITHGFVKQQVDHIFTRCCV